jgi:hypothetical protein
VNRGFHFDAQSGIKQSTTALQVFGQAIITFFHPSPKA